MGLSGLLLGGWGSISALQTGLETGVTMAIRALLVIFTFSALSIEMRNPVIIDWFTRFGMGVLFESISLAFEGTMRLNLSEQVLRDTLLKLFPPHKKLMKRG